MTDVTKVSVEPATADELKAKMDEIKRENKKLEEAGGPVVVVNEPIVVAEPIPAHDKGSKLERIKAVLKDKGMDSQQQHQALDLIEKIIWNIVEKIISPPTNEPAPVSTTTGTPVSGPVFIEPTPGPVVIEKAVVEKKVK